jgi:hypothetical protein
MVLSGFVMPGLVAGHPRLAFRAVPKSWMAGSSPAMTTVDTSALLSNNLQFLQNNKYDKSRCYMTSPFKYKPSIEQAWFRVYLQTRISRCIVKNVDGNGWRDRRRRFVAIERDHAYELPAT